MSKTNRKVEKSCLKHKIPPKVAITDKLEESRKWNKNRTKMVGSGGSGEQGRR